MLPSLQMYNIGVGCDGLPAVDQIQKFLADKCDAASGVWHNQPDGRIQVLTAQEPAGLNLDTCCCVQTVDANRHVEKRQHDRLGNKV